MAATTFRQVRNILKTVVQDCPFAEENVKRLFIIAFSLITGSVLINVAQYLLVVAAVPEFADKLLASQLCNGSDHVNDGSSSSNSCRGF